MGLLDSMIGALAGGQGGGQQQGGGLGGMLGGGTQAAVLSAVIGMLANGQHAQGGGIGGLGDLIGRFTQGGMGDVIGSWVGKGQNAPISGDQLSNVLGSDAIGKIAAQLGLSHADAADQVAQVLPEAVDRLTPNGQAPDGGLGDFGGLLAQLTKR
jgi:uncharacterized protein YidB (DUF937 family)